MDDVIFMAIMFGFVMFSWISAALIAYFAVGARLAEVLAEFQQVKAGLMSAKGKMGGDARVANEERMELAVGEALAAIQAGKTPTDVIKEVGMKYPDVALRLAKKMMSGKL